MTGTVPAPLEETRVRENVFVWTLGGEGIATSYGANCTAVIGKTAVLLVDPFIAPTLARLVEQRLREKTPVPLRHVLITHHHTDHALGAGWFAGRFGAPLFSLATRRWARGRESRVYGPGGPVWAGCVGSGEGEGGGGTDRKARQVT